MKRTFLHIMLSFLLPATMLVESERPKFRADYRFEKVFGAFYKVHRAAVTWAAARVRCEAEGAELMVPLTLDEADAMPVLLMDLPASHEGAYVGMHDLYSERTFVTLDGERVRGSILELLWASRQPAHGGGRCVAMRRDGRLRVHPCGRSLPFVCKAALDRVAHYNECDTFDPRWQLSPTGACYMRHDEPQSWRDAYTTCLLAGGYLAVLKNGAEADHLRSLFKQVPESRVPHNDFAFLGFSDLSQKHHYRTVHDQPLNDLFNEWKLECITSSHGDNKNCGGMNFELKLLVLANCNTPAIFFCEKPTAKSLTRDKKGFPRYT